jgi:hypothetical protein
VHRGDQRGLLHAPQLHQLARKKEKKRKEKQAKHAGVYVPL